MAQAYYDALDKSEDDADNIDSDQIDTDQTENTEILPE